MEIKNACRCFGRRFCLGLKEEGGQSGHKAANTLFLSWMKWC